MLLRLAQLLTSAILFFCGSCHLKNGRKLPGVFNIVTAVLMLVTACLPQPCEEVEEGEESEAEIIILE
ncbi:MAG: hypothetical protein IJC43_03910 [Clostridia bacterium]|nr:hypothetical protein [Clostridia bacterium]